MNERQKSFTWEYEQFIGIWREEGLFKLQQEFDNRNVTLSRSLLIYEETKSTYWLLADFETKKTYEIKKENDTTVEVSEGPDMAGRSDFLNGVDPILPRLRNGTGTHAGIIDAIKRMNFDEFNIEEFKNSVLSTSKLSFESVYPELQDICETLQEILTYSRESLIGLPSNDVVQIKTHIIQFYDITRDIEGFEAEGENFRGTHAAHLQTIRQFRETVKQSLLQAATYLSTKTVEQLENQVKSTLTDAEERFNTKISEEVEKLQKTGAKINEQQVEVLQKSEEKLKEIEQTHIKYQNQLVEEPISKYKMLFENQAKKHRNMSWVWLSATVVLTLVFGVIFWQLLKFLGSVVNQANLLSVILSNLFAKGFYLSLIFLILNRVIKNYAAEKHLEVINTHRKNALETFETFAGATDKPETREQVLLAATKTIFDANQTGYLSGKSTSSDTANPVQQIIKEIIPSKSSTGSD